MGGGVASKLNNHQKLCESVSKEYNNGNKGTPYRQYSPLNDDKHIKKKSDEPKPTPRKNEGRHEKRRDQVPESQEIQTVKGKTKDQNSLTKGDTHSKAKPKIQNSTTKNKSAKGEHDDQNSSSEKTNTMKRAGPHPIPKADKDTKGTFGNFMQEVSKSMHGFDNLSIEDKQRYWPQAGDALVDKNCLEIICTELGAQLLSKDKHAQSVLRAQLDNATQKRKQEKQEKSVVELAMEVIVMETSPDCSTKGCEEVLTHPTFLTALLMRLDNIAKKEPLTVDEKIIFLEGLTIIHNLAVYVAECQDGYDSPGTTGNITQDHSGKMVGIFKTCHTKSNEEIKLLALTALACMKETIPTKKQEEQEEHVQYLCLSLSMALGERDERSPRCSITAMERGIRHLLTVQEIHKKGQQIYVANVAVQCGIVRLLAKGAKSEVLQERKACLDSLRLLCSSSQQCRKELARDTDFVDFLVKIYKNKPKSSDEDKQTRCDLDEVICHELAELILLTLYKYGELSWQGKLQDLQFEDKQEQESSKRADRHVMLSYQWESKPVMLKIKEYLESEDIMTWMNEEKTPNDKNARDAMIQAVEGSSVFIMGVTEKYKNCLPCKKEATHAEACRIPIISLKLQDNYQPSGWLLGPMQGHTFDFKNTGDELNTEKMKQLVTAVKKQQKDFTEKKQKVESKEQGTETNQAENSKTEAGQANKKSKPESGAKTPREVVWVAPYCRQHPNSNRTPREDGIGYIYADPKKDVRDWAKKFNLDGHQVKSLSKKDLDGLVHLKEQAPFFFYKRIWKDLKMKKLSEVKQFEDALSFWQQLEG